MDASEAICRMTRRAMLAAAAGVLCPTGTAWPGEKPPRGNPAPTDRTLGGRQFWGDVRFFRGWRIQKNVFTKHFRLLDERDLRHAYGTLDACEQALNAIRRDRKLPVMSGRCVILVHGIARSSKSMSRLERAFEKAGYLVVPFEYPSTQVKIEESAEYLFEVIDHLDGITDVNFVAHSMGGLVVRAWLKKYCDRRVRRMVMMAVPNRGARLADQFKGNLLFGLLYGRAGQQLGRDPDGFIAGLPTPGFEFAVIAGQAGKPRGYNPLISGDDDGTVSVESTRLPGAADFVTVRAMHMRLLSDRRAIDYSVRFIRDGRLRAKRGRTPIPREPEGLPRDRQPDR